MENVKTFIHSLQRQCIVGPIDEAAKKIFFICKKLYMLQILNEIGWNGTPNPVYKFSSKTKDEIIYENSFLANKFGLNPDKEGKFLVIT